MKKASPVSAKSAASSWRSLDAWLDERCGWKVRAATANGRGSKICAFTMHCVRQWRMMSASTVGEVGLAAVPAAVSDSTTRNACPVELRIQNGSFEFRTRS